MAMKRILTIIVLLIAGSCWGADSTRATWVSTMGTEGLHVVAVKISECSGAPPVVTIEGGATRWVFADVGDGIYIRFLPMEEYHVFVEDVWSAVFWQGTMWLKEQILAMQANNWVTLARMADNSSGSAEIVDGSIAAADLGTGCVTSSKLAAANVYWSHLNNTVKGSGVDTLFTIKLMQDTLRLMKGARWNAGTDYTLDGLDSLMKKLVLNLAFAAPCTVKMEATGRPTGVRVVWRMSDAHDDSAVYRYRIYFCMTAPAFYSAGQLDSAEQVVLAEQMDVSYKIEPKRYVNTYFYPGRGLQYVVVTAEDWLGTVWGSAWDSASSGDAGVGEVTKLIGAPGYTAGMDGMTALRDAMTAIDNLEKAQAEMAAAAVAIYNDEERSTGAVGAKADVLRTYYSTFNAKEDGIQVRAAAVRPSGYSWVELWGQTRMKSIGEKGTVWLVAGGQTVQWEIGNTGTALDTTWGAFSLRVTAAGMTVGAAAEIYYSLTSSQAADTAMVRKPVIWMVK